MPICVRELRKEFFWSEALKNSELAIKNGAVIPLETIISKLNVRNKNFELRHLKTKLPQSLQITGPKLNPFKPWDNRLSISKILNKHQLILNKYPVQIGHMLLITNNWKPQNGWLSYDDFLAIATVESDTSGLWFFNSCKEAGASQPHRHIQLLRRESKSLICPREEWFDSLLCSNINRNSNLFKSVGIQGRSIKETNKSKELYDKYLKLSLSLKIGNPNIDKKPLCPYNLIITDNWISLIRRLKDKSYGFSINALGFAGYFLATDNSDTNYLLNNGAENLLNDVVNPAKD